MQTNFKSKLIIDKIKICPECGDMYRQSKGYSRSLNIGPRCSQECHKISLKEKFKEYHKKRAEQFTKKHPRIFKNEKEIISRKRYWPKIQSQKLDLADTRFSQCIRLRDKQCLCCRQVKVEFNAQGLPITLQNSHFISRKNYAVRWDPRNCDTVCNDCHRFWEENKSFYREFKKVQLGEAGYKKLWEDALKVVNKRENRQKALSMTRAWRKDLLKK